MRMQALETRRCKCAPQGMRRSKKGREKLKQMVRDGIPTEFRAKVATDPNHGSHAKRRSSHCARGGAGRAMTPLPASPLRAGVAVPVWRGRQAEGDGGPNLLQAAAREGGPAGGRGACRAAEPSGAQPSRRGELGDPPVLLTGEMVSSTHERIHM